MKRLFVLTVLMIAMLFGCTQVNEDTPKNNNQKQESNNTPDDNQSGDNNGGNQGGENTGGNTDKPAVKITVTFVGADGEVLETMEKSSGERVLLSVKVDNLSHWNTKADGSGLSYKGSATFGESVTLYAILLAENAHVISYMLDGGVNNPQNSFSFTEDDFIGLKNPSKDGYKFLGWYENRDFTGNAIKGWGAGDKTADVTLYAKWEKESEPAVKVTITFNVNGAGGTVPAAIETTSDKSVDLPTLANSKFSHWNTKADGSGQSYKGSAIFGESVTLYAILLAENAHKITYVLDGGVNNSQNKYSFTEDDMVALREPTRDGYKFLGWYETADFSGEAIKVWFEGEKTTDVTLYAKWEKEKGDLTVGSGVYSYTLDIEDIATNWGGSTTSPAFSVVLLTDEGLEKCVAEQDFKVNPAAEPEYQLGAFSNMRIKDTAEKGTFKVYGANPVDDEYHYYNGVAATITDKTFTLTVDMTKVVITDLKALWEGDSEKVMTNEDIVDLTGYKPYVVALGDHRVDEDNYKLTAWNADVMAMAAGATFPTDLKEDAPVVPTCNALNSIAGYMTGWNHTALVNNSFTFTATGQDDFAFTVGTWEFQVRDATIYALDEEVRLYEHFGSDCITFAEGVLTVGTEYTVTLIVKGPHEAYVKVTDLLSTKEIESISVKSTSGKSCYTDDYVENIGIYINVYTADGDTFERKVTSSMVSGFDSSVVGTKTLTITYKGCTTTFEVEIVERPTYTITFDANSGSGTMKSQTVGKNLSCGLNTNTFTAPDGYVFSHWNTKTDGSGKTYYMNNSYSFSNDMTLYAIWEKVENNFDVSLPGSTSFSIYQSTDGNYVTFKCSNWYDSHTWYIDGVKTSTSREMTIDTSTMKVGIYTIMLKVKNNGTYWSETTTLMVNK